MPTSIQTFLSSVRSRLNCALLLRGIVGIVLVAAVTCIMWAVAWRIFGYAAPWLGYAVACGGVILVAVFIYFFKRLDTPASARFADQFFHLKDGLVSFLEFHTLANKDDEVFQLQQRNLEGKIQEQDSTKIPLRIQPRKVWCAALLTIAAIALSLLPHSNSIIQKIAQEKLTLERSTQISSELEKVVEEIIKEMTEQEKELLKPEVLREWVKDIEGTKDQRESMKQLAKFEQKISEAMRGLEARKDEEMLKLAAAELEASQLADAKQLAQKLDAKDFENAKQQLADLKPGKPQDLKKLTPEEMKKLLEKSAKLKEMSRRMANGAQKRDFNQKDAKDPKNAKPAGDQKLADAKDMGEMLQELDEAAAEMDADLQKMEQGEAGDDDGEAMGKMDGKLDELAKRLGKLDAKDKARMKMKALAAGAGECQKFANGQSSSLSKMLGLAQQPGGQKQGTGHLENKRNESDQDKDNGNLTQLNGKQNGDGPSRSSVEQADSGMGISGKGATEKNRDFRKQTESLVHRDDVPEELKQGVREYFNRVHESE